MNSLLAESYDPTLFAEFLRSFLPEDYTQYGVAKEFGSRDLRIVRGAYILGECASLGDLKVIEVHHDKLNDPRVTLATEVFRLMTESFTHRALVVFVNEKSAQWRFSLMTIDFTYDKSK